MADTKPTIVGPDADEIKVEQIPDATGYSIPEMDEEAEPIGVAEASLLLGAKKAADEASKPTIDPAFPFGRPEDIDWSKIDAAGHDLLKEVNIRPWMKSVEYCSGHPLNRHPEELSELYPYVTGENVYEEINRLDLAFIRGLIPDVFFRYRKQEIRSMGATRFYLNVNVYSIEIFLQWTKILAGMVTASTQSVTNPLIVRFNPNRPGVNYSIYWDYWTAEERNLIHYLVSESLDSVPV